ncbi:MAG: DNA repair protein RecO [Patescibacteria group bacterium]
MTQLTTGIILRRDHYNDFDRQYIVYTRDLGKVTAIAKGAKKIISKLSGHLEPFLVIDLMLAGNSRYKRVAGAGIAKRYRKISGSLEKIIIADYFLEAIDALIKYDFIDQEVFFLADNFLAELSLAPDAKHGLLILNKSLFGLLSHLGYCPVIRAKTQRQLIIELNNLAVNVGEKEIRTFNSLLKIF